MVQGRERFCTRSSVVLAAFGALCWGLARGPGQLQPTVRVQSNSSAGVVLVSLFFRFCLSGGERLSFLLVPWRKRRKFTVSNDTLCVEVFGFFQSGFNCCGLLYPGDFGRIAFRKIYC